MKFQTIKPNIPNFLTFFRLFSAPLFIFLLYLNDDFSILFALLIFILAAISDFLDGYLARYWNAQSIIGKVLDPIADKLVVLIAIMMLVYLKIIYGIHIFAAIITLSREIIISGFREALAELKFSIPVSKVGKYKTTIQLISISFLLITPIKLLSNYHTLLKSLQYIGFSLLWISTILSLYSGINYIKDGFKFLTTQEKNNQKS